jgi:hypothetical protein
MVPGLLDILPLKPEQVPSSLDTYYILCAWQAMRHVGSCPPSGPIVISGVPDYIVNGRGLAIPETGTLETAANEVDYMVAGSL